MRNPSPFRVSSAGLLLVAVSRETLSPAWSLLLAGLADEACAGIDLQTRGTSWTAGETQRLLAPSEWPGCDLL